MPFLAYNTEYHDVNAGIWRLEEDEMYFHTRLKLYEHEWEKLATIRHPQKRLEWLSSRLCMKELLKISHTDRIESLNNHNGKPYLSNNSHFICYTHSQRYAAAIASPSREVGIDLEDLIRRRNPNTRRLFMDEVELAIYESEPSTELFLVIWSIKETIYKLYSEKGLSFKEDIHLQLQNHSFSQKGNIAVRIQKDADYREYNAFYEVFPEFVITYGIAPVSPPVPVF